jgi:mannan endo-1,4-beta-mannosidase
MTETNAQPDSRRGAHRSTARPPKRPGRKLLLIGVTLLVVAIAAAIVVTRKPSGTSVHHIGTVPYLGIFEPDAPGSYSGLNQVAQSIGRQPNLASYYSHWLTPFQVEFATSAERNGATTLVQISPGAYSLTRIAEGKYDNYLRSFATAVKAFGRRVILSFGHEMNGTWYSWGYRHASPTAFVAAWRHIVAVFRETGARNVTWLWTVNIIARRVPAPGPWWPGSSYVNWVGIDGYFWYKAASFTTVFAPTIVDVRQLTHDPILIAETGAEPAVGQAAKIDELFAGVQTYGLLGFVWFNDDTVSAAIPGEALDWRLGSAALAALREDAKEYLKSSLSPRPS